MSYGRNDGGLPGQSPGGKPFGGLEPTGRGGGSPQRMPGKKAGGGGLMMLLIIGAVMMFMMRGSGNGAKQQNQDGAQPEAPGGMESKPWKPTLPGDRKRESSRDDNRSDRDFGIDIPGRKNKSDKSDRVETGDGWSMEDAKTGDDKKENRLPFSRKKKSPKSDKVKNDDGWSMGDAKTDKEKGTNVPLSNQKEEPPKSDEVKNSDGWKMKDATEKKKKGRGNG